MLFLIYEYNGNVNEIIICIVNMNLDIIVLYLIGMKVEMNGDYVLVERNNL